MEHILFGKKFTPSLALSNYNAVRQQLLAKQKVIVANFHTTYIDALSQLFSLSIEILSANGVFAYSKEQFAANFEKNYGLNFLAAHDTLSNKYLDIIEKEAQKDAYRSARRKGRGQVIGGGFGFEGAVKGMAKAGAMNAASGIAHGAFNTVGKIGSMVGESIKKSNLRDDKAIRTAIIDAVRRDTFQIHFAVEDAL